MSSLTIKESNPYIDSITYTFSDTDISIVDIFKQIISTKGYNFSYNKNNIQLPIPIVYYNDINNIIMDYFHKLYTNNSEIYIEQLKKGLAYFNDLNNFNSIRYGIKYFQDTIRNITEQQAEIKDIPSMYILVNMKGIYLYDVLSNNKIILAKIKIVNNPKTDEERYYTINYGVIIKLFMQLGGKDMTIHFLDLLLELANNIGNLVSYKIIYPKYITTLSLPSIEQIKSKISVTSNSNELKKLNNMLLQIRISKLIKNLDLVPKIVKNTYIDGDNTISQKILVINELKTYKAYKITYYFRNNINTKIKNKINISNVINYNNLVITEVNNIIANIIKDKLQKKKNKK